MRAYEMSKYGDVALDATNLVITGSLQPTVAWEEATRRVYPDSTSLQDKSCPRGAYLGLCEAGLVAHIPVGTYTKSRNNKGYAIRAVELLISQPTLADAGSKALWELVMNGQTIAHNAQMDVVLTLWRNDLIVRSDSSV